MTGLKNVVSALYASRALEMRCLAFERWTMSSSAGFEGLREGEREMPMILMGVTTIRGSKQQRDRAAAIFNSMLDSSAVKRMQDVT